MSQPKPTIPPGSLVLITGITGFVAAHTAKQLLERGYRVRGTARNLATASWLTEDLFKKYSARGDFELVEVPDIGADKAYDDVVPGVAAIMHVALSDFDADPNKVIPKNVSGINGLLAAALREPSVRAFVFTSSIAASASLVDQSEVRRDSWNDAAVDAAWAPPPYEAARAMVVYMASKVAAEKALWRFVEERHPPFAVNVVSPASILGLPLGSKHANAGPGYPTWMLRRLYEGDTVAASMFPALIAIDVEDVALLHVAAALDADTKSARLQVWGRHAAWNDFLAIMRRLWPGRKFIDDLPDTAYLGASTDQSQSLALLKKWGGRDDWKPLDESVRDTIVTVK